MNIYRICLDIMQSIYTQVTRFTRVCFSPHNPDKERVMVVVGHFPKSTRKETVLSSTEFQKPAERNGVDDELVNIYRQSQQQQRLREDDTLNISRRPSERKTKYNIRSSLSAKTTVEQGEGEGEEGEDLQFSMTSVLNQRPTDIMIGLSDNRLNVRYNKRRAPTPPIATMTNGVVANGVMTNGHVVTSVQTTVVAAETKLHDLSDNRINTRYFANGEGQSEVSGELSSNKLNNRYVKSGGRSTPGVKSKPGTTEYIISKKDKRDRMSVASDASAANSDWSHWVEDVFSSALNEHDDLSDGRSLEQRIKGGGKGVPGLQTQQVFMIIIMIIIIIMVIMMIIIIIFII